MDWQKGQVIGGKYKIESVLGEGGFGITYKATHKDLGIPFVIKTPRARLKFEPNYHRFIERFKQEGLLLARLSQKPHDHIVRIIDFFEEPDPTDRHQTIPCLVMDFIEGESLYKLVGNQGALPETKAVEYIRQIGSALTVIHQAGLVHWDVTPPNIMVRENRKAVLIDFGIAGNCPPSSFSREFGNRYFAPYEQIMLGERTIAVDVYTLAASLYYAVTGTISVSSCERKIGRNELVAPRDYANISASLNQAILWGMKLEPQDRPKSIQVWLETLSSESDHLNSVKGVDYTKLRDLLKTGKWQEADEETAKRMLEVAGQTERGWLETEDIDNFPCEDLRTIDQLWVKYSKGRFGFSVQKRIYQSLGGTRAYDSKIWQAFCDRVGWRKDGEWLYYKDLTFNTSAQQGHLPIFVVGGGLKKMVGGGYGSLLSRRDL